jgi:hypothetical protein
MGLGLLSREASETRTRLVRDAWAASEPSMDRVALMTGWINTFASPDELTAFPNGVRPYVEAIIEAGIYE